MLFAALYGRSIHIGKAGDLFGEQAIPEFPSQALGQAFGDGGGAAAVLALDADQTEHSCTPLAAKGAGDEPRFAARLRACPSRVVLLAANQCTAIPPPGLPFFIRKTRGIIRRMAMARRRKSSR